MLNADKYPPPIALDNFKKRFTNQKLMINDKTYWMYKMKNKEIYSA